MQYHFEEQFNHRLQKRQEGKANYASYASGKTLYQARVDNVTTKEHAILLKNKVDQLLMNQDRAKQKLALQNKETLKVLKQKYIQEQQRIQKKLNHELNIQNNNDKRTQCQNNKEILSQNIQKNQYRVAQIKKANRNQLFEEGKNIDNEKQLIRHKELLEKKYLSNLVKENKNVSKLNIHKFWDYKIQMNDLNRNRMLFNQIKDKKQAEAKLQTLQMQENQIQEQYNQMMEEQREMQKQMKSARSMSVKQFSEMYPEFYEENRRSIITKTQQKAPMNMSNKSMQKSQGLMFALTTVDGAKDQLRASQIIINSENDNDSQILGNLGNSD